MKLHHSYGTVIMCIPAIFLMLGSGCSDTTGPSVNINYQPRQGIVSDAGNEPPQNQFLASSLWPMSHRNPYCQASSPYSGPVGQTFSWRLDSLRGFPGAITLAFSNTCPDGSYIVWGSNQRSVFKVRCDLLKKEPGYADSMTKEDFSLSDTLDPDVGISGAYTLVDRDGTFFVPRFQRIYAYADAVAGDACSGIILKGSFSIPEKWRIDRDEIINGINLTYDGMLAFVTNRGLLCVVSRSFDRAFYYRFGSDEEISNSIACDEKGGIYVVTSKKMYRVQWTGRGLTINERAGGWSALYETGVDISGIRLGTGSGSTPTLMGTGRQDRFVVITDGQDLMHIVLFWRDRIPAGWKKISGVPDRRIAAQIPVTFGDPDARKSLSEQSVCVRGYGALVVNNQLNMTGSNRLWSIIRSGNPKVAPRGIEKFVWDPGTRKLSSAWVNREISFPNGIPCMSAATGLVYDVGQRKGIWTFEAVDWETGNSVFHYRIGSSIMKNSVWAATEIGPGGTLWSGSLSGFMTLTGAEGPKPQ